MRAALILALVAGLVAMLPAAPASAQEAAADDDGPEGRQGDRLGWHLVRPGDTLRGITRRYLGTEAPWRENHRLNPDIVNPDFLLPGQRLRVILERQLPDRSAEITQLARRVEAKPQPNEWQAAQRGDLLAESDGLRTYQSSSAELSFDDGARLTVTENSLVFLQRFDSTSTGVRQETIEIVQGQADLAARSQPRRVSDIEIVVVGATARPKPGDDGVSESRSRATDDAAQLMVYAGSSEVEAGGAKVDVARGMGTVVPEGEAPMPPERLLAAPRLTQPAAGEAFAFGNPIFRWSAVASAASYTVEVCADAGCGELVERTIGVDALSWQPERLPPGELYWRVTAVAASGLDGYPAGGWLLTVAGDPDLLPPAVAVVRLGAGRSEPGRAVVGEGGTLTLSAHDDASGVEEVRYRWDGGGWTVWRGGELAPAGELLEVQAVDRAGRESEVWSIEVQRAGAAPEPPRLGG